MSAPEPAAPDLETWRWKKLHRLREPPRACASGNASGNASGSSNRQRQGGGGQGGDPQGSRQVRHRGAAARKDTDVPCPQARGVARAAWCAPRGVDHVGDGGRVLNGVGT